MKTTHGRLAFAEPGEARDLAAFLKRQLGWDRAASVRLTAGGEVAALFTRPARFGVLAVRPGRLREPARIDATVSAGELLEGIDEERDAVAVPAPVTGPAWAGVLPPRGGWQQLAQVPHGELGSTAAAVVAEFRERSERLAGAERTREALDAIAEEIWSRTLPGTPLPLRVVHAAHALGFLRARDAAPATVLRCGVWLRLGTPPGSIAVRTAGVGGLSVTPL
ncbi:hypothetical protein [Streptomyces sp. 6N223]|uniref:hypothetical protein n=1 Tax=Streptomyces sp. 6N223 TaxID=3457412 RepID=UPI003FD4F402